MHIETFCEAADLENGSSFHTRDFADKAEKIRISGNVPPSQEREFYITEYTVFS